VRVTVIPPLGVTATQWWNHGPEPGNDVNHWWSFTYDGQTGLSGFGGILSLDFVDGQRGDRGGTVNGHVTAVGGPARQLFCVMEAATIIGSDGPETINGTGAKDVIVALGGNDTVNGMGGNDVICGGAGGDTVNGGDGADHILGEAGNDHLFGNDGADNLDGGPGFDVLRGGPGADTLVNGEDSIP
jgi:Ca2+-binding RTX toxin-like protein